MLQLNYWLSEMALAHEYGDVKRQRHCRRFVIELERHVTSLRAENQPVLVDRLRAAVR